MADHLKIEDRIEELQDLVEEKKQKLDNHVKETQGHLRTKESEVRSQEQQVENQNRSLDSFRTGKQDVQKSLVERLSQKTGLTVNGVKQGLIDELQKEARTRAQNEAQAYEEEIKETAEIRAKRMISVTIDRFARPYCSERGLGAVEFQDENTRNKFLAADKSVIKAVQDSCGCDLYTDAESMQISIAGFDPVRRELTRRTLEKILKSKNWDPRAITQTADNCKRELFKQIKKDGDMISKELGIMDLHPEIRQMMGSLRYRYSFTQNQYFHCGEVGWLCGLLASELGLQRDQQRKGRRSGLLHDLGKSMDHAVDGGHAVIGADFIKERGEAPDVVHAVRAHHYDEQPSTDLAFLVIAADAISGARPGARRSTMESYTQKVTELEAIAKSFEGVVDCYILNGGREVRVIANGKTVDDPKALEISRNIAARIEEECNYPGQIKVVVVRGTIATEMTMAR
ncbi:MAG: Rnase Y domain-containing protein [Pseudobdellovibrionaceae bacterium]